MKKAFLTGVTGQDGSYLAELLLEKGYEVHSIMRRASVFTSARIDHLVGKENFIIHHGDLADSSNLHRLITTIKPDEVYNLGAQSHVKVSFEVPEYTADVDGLGAIRILDAVRDLDNGCKFYLHMALQSYMLFGFLLITESHIISLPAMEYFLIMSPQEEEKLLYLKK